MKSPFGRFIQQLRLTTVTELAHMLGVSIAYASAVCSGKRNIPSAWLQKLPELFEMTETEVADMNEAARQSVASITIDLRNVSDTKRELAVLFARNFRQLDESAIAEIKHTLQS